MTIITGDSRRIASHVMFDIASSPVRAHRRRPPTYRARRVGSSDDTTSLGPRGTAQVSFQLRPASSVPTTGKHTALLIYTLRCVTRLHYVRVFIPLTGLITLLVHCE
jgi:hypothetical protein